MILRRTGLLACLTGVAMLAAPIEAQEAPEADDEDIVVTGQIEKPPREQVDRQARDITESRGDLLHTPLARIEAPLCPGVIGLKADAAALLIDRIRWMGDKLDMWMADDTSCAPNLIVAFVDDGKAELAEIASNHPYMFASLTPTEREGLLREDGPVHVWTTTVMRGANGITIPTRNSLTSPPQIQANAFHSKIYLNVREDIDQVVVLFDRAGVRGKTVIQLADYATMRGFARTRPADGEAPIDTILALFDEGAIPPSGLTDFDKAYLRSLYEGIPNLRGQSRILGVNQELKQVIEEREEGAEE